MVAGKPTYVAPPGVGSEALFSRYFAVRPASERLITKKLDLGGLNVMRDWRTCLDEYVKDAYATYLDRR